MLNQSTDNKAGAEPVPPSLMDAMRKLYRQTGEVRAEDVVRIFGDPRQGIFMRGGEEPECPKHSAFSR